MDWGDIAGAFSSLISGCFPDLKCNYSRSKLCATSSIDTINRTGDKPCIVSSTTTTKGSVPSPVKTHHHPAQWHNVCRSAARLQNISYFWGLAEHFIFRVHTQRALLYISVCATIDAYDVHKPQHNWHSITHCNCASTVYTSLILYNFLLCCCLMRNLSFYHVFYVMRSQCYQPFKQGTFKKRKVLWLLKFEGLLS